MGCEFAQGPAFGQPMTAAAGAQIDGRGAGVSARRCGQRGEARVAALSNAQSGADVESRDEILARIPRRNPRPGAGVPGGGRARQAEESRGANGAGSRRSTPSARPRFSSTIRSSFYHDFSSGKQRRHLHLPGRHRGPELPRGGRAAGGHGRRADAAARRRRARRATSSARACTKCSRSRRDIFEQTLHDPVGRQGARLSRRPPARSRRPSAQFGIGYAAPRRFALRDALAAKGVDADQMIEAGLLVHGEGIAVPYDRFQNRVMFPIHDRGGPRRRVRRARARSRRQGEIPQFAGDRALPQGIAALQPSSRAQARARQRRDHRRRGLCRRRSR